MIGYKTEQPYVISKKIISVIEKFLADRKLHLAMQVGFTWPNCWATNIPPKICRYYYLNPVSVKEAFESGSLKLSNRGIKGLIIKDIWGEKKPHTIQLKYNKDKLKADVIKALQSETNVGKLISIANDLGIEIDINEKKELS